MLIVHGVTYVWDRVYNNSGHEGGRKMNCKQIITVVVVVVVVTLLIGCKQSNEIGVASSVFRSTSNAIVPKDFAWSKLTHNQDYRIDPKTKEKVYVNKEYLNCRISLPKSIERLPLKPCSDFTEEEKMLAYGVKNIESGVVGDGVGLILMNYRRYFREHNRAPDNIFQFPDYAFLKNPQKLAEYYNILSVHPEAVAAFSPVAKVPFSFNNKEFTKGQLYITRITDKEWLKNEGKSYGENVTPEEYLKEKEKGFDTSSIVNLYYRVYGENMTIAEGYLEFNLNE